MKKIYLPLCLFLLSVTLLQSQNICVGDVSLTSQEEVNAFDCTEVTGTLTITGSSVVDLTPLKNLKRVGEHFIIFATSNLTNVDGLENLEEVNCSLEFKSNTALQQVYGLENIKRVGRNLTFYNNRWLVTLEGIQSIDSVNDVRILNNPLLEYCCALNGLISSDAVYGSVYIDSNNAKCRPSAENPCPTSPVVCEGDVSIFLQSQADNFNCSIITGNLGISEIFLDDDLDLDSLFILEEIYGDLNVSGVEQSANLPLLANLKSIGGELSASVVGSGGGSINLDNLPLLESVQRIRLYFHGASGRLTNLTDTLHLIDMQFGSFGDLSWLNEIPPVDSVIINSADADPEQLQYAYASLSDDGYLSINQQEVLGFEGMQSKSSLGSFICSNCFSSNLDGLVNLETVDSLNLSIVRFDLSEEGWEQEYCGIYNLFTDNPDLSDYSFSVIPVRGPDRESLTIEDILTNCATTDEINAMSIYPNPAVNQAVTLTWQGNDAARSQIELISPTGNLLSRRSINSDQGVNSYELNTGPLKQGVYLVRIVTGESVKLNRLVIR